MHHDEANMRPLSKKLSLAPAMHLPRVSKTVSETKPSNAQALTSCQSLYHLATTAALWLMLMSLKFLAKLR